MAYHSLPKVPVTSMELTDGDHAVASPALRTGLQVALAEAILRVLDAQGVVSFTGTDEYLALTIAVGLVCAVFNKVEGVLGIKLLAPR